MTSPSMLLDEYVNALKTVDALVALIGSPDNIVADHLQMPISKSWGDVVAELATFEGSQLIVRHDATRPVGGEAGVWFRHEYKITWKADGVKYGDVVNALIGAVLPSGKRLIYRQIFGDTGAIAKMMFRTVPIRIGDSTIKEVGQVEFGIDDRDN